MSTFLILAPGFVWSQGLVLNEIVSSNQGSMVDEDGETPDWIELYNSASSPIALSGYGLTDDPTDPFKWVFEDGMLAPESHLIVFASEKDRQSLALNWNLVITAGDIWKYMVGTSEPPSSWKSLSFNDGAWASGPTGIGYGDNDDATQISQTMSVYLRKEFTVSDLAALSAVMFHMDVDDGYIAYINGVEIGRQNMGAPGSFKAYNAGADQYTEPSLPYGVDLLPVLLDADLLVQGSNVLAIQVHNSDLNSSDLTALPFLSLGGAGIVGDILPDYLIYSEGQRFHTNFKISSSGEELLLTHSDGTLADSLSVPPLTGDLAYGRQPDGQEPFLYFNTPTPGAPNTGGFSQLPVTPVPSLPPGFYNGTITVQFDLPGDGTTFRYTISGNEPDDSSPLYLAPLNLATTTILRVRSTSPDGQAHRTVSFSYFINADHDLPVMSLICNPGSFFDNDTGIYVLGDNASSEFPYFGANFWEDWEREIHIEYFENHEDLSFSAPGGVKIFGNYSRGQAQRSLVLFARGEYGVNEFDYPFFPARAYDRFQSLVLRNSGNDWNITGYRDVFMTDLVADRDIERQAFQPAEVYLNGAYWGIYNLREKVSEHFVASIANIDAEDVDLLEFYGVALHGSGDEYAELVNYVEAQNLGSEANFEYVRERVDLENFIDYQFSQIYFDNQDWPGNNIKFWKSHHPTSRWRWILFDTDFGFGIWNQNNYMNNTLEFALSPNGPGWPNPPWSTLFLRKFINNASFTREFILRGTDLLNSNFEPETVLETLAERRDAMVPGIIDHFSRWQQNNVNNWNWQYSVMQTFAELRPAYVRTHLQNRFNLQPANLLTIQVEPESSGIIRVHSLMPEDLPWSGLYFPNIPIDISALPAAGYVFSHWEGFPSQSPDLLVNMDSPRNLTAVFIADPGSVPQMVINEINYNSAADQDAKDWIELHNFSPTGINLDGWSVSDGDDQNVFFLPDLAVGPEGYIVISSDSLAFREIHGSASPLIGDLDFNFSNGGELIRLFDPLGNLVDSLTYDDETPWPTEPDGDGPTLELIHPALDNPVSENWAASLGLGTPGTRNSRYAVPSGLASTMSPDALELTPAYPNPFNAQVTLPMALPSAGSFTIQIYDIRGALIQQVELNMGFPGLYNYRWDGKNALGRECSSGMYVVRVIQGEVSRSIKIAILR